MVAALPLLKYCCMMLALCSTRQPLKGFSMMRVGLVDVLILSSWYRCCSLRIMAGLCKCIRCTKLFDKDNNKGKQGIVWK